MHIIRPFYLPFTQTLQKLSMLYSKSSIPASINCLKKNAFSIHKVFQNCETPKLCIIIEPA